MVFPIFLVIIFFDFSLFVQLIVHNINFMSIEGLNVLGQLKHIVSSKFTNSFGFSLFILE